jgi:hypothetical protein
MVTTRLSQYLAILLLGTAVLISGAAVAQEKKAEESDQAFLSRMERELNMLQARADNVERWVRQKMGMSNATGYRAGVSATATPGRTATNPMDSELRRMRLELRSMKKKIDRERERMGEQYKSRDQVEFDRAHWNVVVRRFEVELIEMERDLRRL